MLDLSKVPVIDSDVKIRSYQSLDGIRCINLEDEFTHSVIYFPESKFNKCFKAFKDVLENEGKYRKYFAYARGHQWFRPIEIEPSFSGSDYFIVDRVPIYVEMFKHISKCKVCLDRNSLLSQNLYILEAVNKKIKRCKKLNKIEGLLYLNL